MLSIESMKALHFKVLWTSVLNSVIASSLLSKTDKIPCSSKQLKNLRISCYILTTSFIHGGTSDFWAAFSFAIVYAIFAIISAMFAICSFRSAYCAYSYITETIGLQVCRSWICPVLEDSKFTEFYPITNLRNMLCQCVCLRRLEDTTPGHQVWRSDRAVGKGYSQVHRSRVRSRSPEIWVVVTCIRKDNIPHALTLIKMNLEIWRTRPE